jgi:predicted nucleotidyltransferase
VADADRSEQGRPDRRLPEEFNAAGDLPAGIHSASLHEVLERFGDGTLQRLTVASRLARIHSVAMSTGQVRRFIVFGSFVTAKPNPNDVDVFLLMEDSFTISDIVGEARMLFDHSVAEARFGASIFWLRHQAAFGGEDATVAHWQIKRDGSRRGIIEIVREES